MIHDQLCGALKFGVYPTITGMICEWGKGKNVIIWDNLEVME